MLEFIGKLENLSMDFKKGTIITFSTNSIDKNILDDYIKLKDKDVIVKFDLKREKRSLDANAYFWVLASKLAEKLNVKREEVYINMIRDVGVATVVPIKTELVDRWIETWSVKGLGWFAEIYGESKIKGYTNVICYYGSSTYNNKEMSRLIDLAIESCKEQGIETLPPDEINKLKEMWKNE